MAVLSPKARLAQGCRMGLGWGHNKGRARGSTGEKCKYPTASAHFGCPVRGPPGPEGGRSLTARGLLPKVNAIASGPGPAHPGDRLAAGG